MNRLARRLTPHRVLALVLVCFALLAGAVLALTPPWEANDEPDHVRNVEILASGHWYRITSDSGFEPQQAPLYYLALAAYQELLGMPAVLPDGQLARIADDNRHGVYRHDIPQDGRDQRRVGLLRLPSLVFGLFAILLTFIAARAVTRDRWTPVVAAAVVAGVPKFIFLSGVVNNDNLSDALGAAALAVALTIVVSPPQRARGRVLGAAGVGVIAGAAVLTKATAGLIAPGLLLAVLLAARGRREMLRLGTAFVAAALAVCGWWFVQNQVRYGDPLALHASERHLKAYFPPLLDVAGPLTRVFDQIPRGIYSTFWYDSGYNQFVWHWYWYVPFWGLAALGIVALAWRRGPERPGGTSVIWVCSLVAIGALASVWVLGIRTTTEQARVAFVGLPAIAILVALGYERMQLAVGWRFALPALGFIGTVAAIRYDVILPYLHS